MCPNIYLFFCWWETTHLVEDKYSNSTTTDGMIQTVAELRRLYRTEWKSKKLVCFELHKTVTMFHIFLASLIVWFTSAQGECLNQDLTISSSISVKFLKDLDNYIAIISKSEYANFTLTDVQLDIL